MTPVDSAELAVDGPWQHRFVPANGARFHVAVAGPDDRDAPLVVLLHDVMQDWWSWRHQLPRLADAGYRVAAMDLRGTGGSDKPPHGYDVPTLATDVARVVRSLGADEAVLIGSGTGAGVAWTTAAMHGDVVLAIGALSAAHPLDAHSAPLRPAAARHLAYALLPSLPERSLTQRGLLPRLLATFGGGHGWPDAATVHRYRRALQVPFAAHSQLEQVRWLVRSAPRLDGRRFHAAFDDVRPVPVLHLHGDADGVRTATSVQPSPRAMAGASTYRWELVRGRGHYLPEEAPDLVGDLLLDWLAEVVRPPALPPHPPRKQR